MTQELAQEGTALMQTVAELQVIDAPGFERAGEMVKAVTVYIKRVGEVMDPIVRATDAAHTVAVRQRDALLKPAQGAKRILGERMGAYEEGQARLRRQAEEAARREQDRLEFEEQKRVASEEVRLRAEAIEQRLSEAVAAEQAGDTVRAQALVGEPIIVAPVAPRPVFVAPPPMAQPKVEGVSFRDQFDFEIENETLIPREYMVPDRIRIGTVVRAMKERTKIPGIKVIQTRRAAVRA